jgi:beta-glucanase (GH16 family)
MNFSGISIFFAVQCMAITVFSQKNLVKTVVETPTFCDMGYYKYVFGDEFDGTRLDTAKWYTYYPYGENTRKDSCAFCRTHVSANIYRDENCLVRDGRLWLKSDTSQAEWFGKPFSYTSGMVHSKQIFHTYGKYEIRCKLPKGKQQWPAFWIFGWNTEIDVFEFICRGPEKLEFSVHKWLTNYCDNDNPSKGKPCHSNQSKILDFDVDFSEDFHTFTMEYEPHLIKFYIDDVMVRVVPKYYNEKKKPLYHCPLKPGIYYTDPAFPIPGEPVQVIANQSVCRRHKEKNAVYPNYLEIDYIRVFQKTIQPDLVGKGHEMENLPK